MGLFKIYAIGQSKPQYTVYAVMKEGMGAMFLICDGLQWSWVSSQDFLPVGR